MVYSVSFSPDGKTIASTSSDKTVKLWDIATGKEIKTLKGHSGVVRSVSFSPDGKMIASGSYDKTIRLWSIDGQTLKVLKGHNAEVSNLGFCPDGQVIASASADNTIKLWGLDGKLIKSLAGHLSLIDSLDCSPDSKTIGAASRDGTVMLWSRDNQELKTKYFKLEKESVNYYASNELLVGEATEAKKSAVLTSDIESMIVQKMSSAKLIHIATHGSIDDINDKDNTRAFSHDGNIFTIAYDEQVKLYKNTSLLHILKHEKPVSSMTIEPKGNKMITGCEDGTIHQWNLIDGKLLRSIKAYDNKVRSLNYSNNGQIITSKSDANIIRNWNSDLSSNQINFIVVIVVLVFGLFGSVVLFVVIKRRQTGHHNNTSNAQSSYIITGWIVCVLPEDWLGNLEALRYELMAAEKPTSYIRFMTVITLLDMLCGGIRVKLQDLYDGNDFMAVIGRRSISDSKDKLANHKDLNK